MDQQNFTGSNYSPMKMTDWLVTFIIQAIPLIGLIMLFVWAFGDGTHPSKKTWAQALLLFAAIMLVISLIFFIMFFSMIATLFSGMGSYS